MVGREAADSPSQMLLPQKRGEKIGLHPQAPWDAGYCLNPEVQGGALQTPSGFPTPQGQDMLTGV